MIAFLIDPEFGTISQIEISAMSTLKDLYKNIDCHTVDLVGNVLDGHDLFVDDEGLLYDVPPHGLFQIRLPDGYETILAGRGVIIGHDGEGNCEDAKCSAQDVAKIARQVIRIDGAKQQIDTAEFKIA